MWAAKSLARTVAALPVVVVERPVWLISGVVQRICRVDLWRSTVLGVGGIDQHHH